MAWTERLPSSPVRFVLVGALAATVHYAVALLLHGAWAVPPAWANAAAFGTAFPVSYLGHRLFSFPEARRPHIEALPRFLMVALGGFVGNQALLLALLSQAAWPFWLALGTTLVAVAAVTYVLSRHWAFAAAVKAQP